MRIIAGSCRGRALKTPEGRAVRPTSDKVRGAVFNIIAHAAFSRVLFNEDLRVADLFCGTGALGLEALSRGAAHCIFIDSAKESLALTRSNAVALKLISHCTFLERDATLLPKADTPYGLLFLDPPYGKGLIAPVLMRLAQQGWLAKESLIIAETGRDEAPAKLPHFILHERREYGDTAVQFLSLASAPG